MEELIIICKTVVDCLIEEKYNLLKQENVLNRVSENDIRRVLKDYGGSLTKIPDEAFKTNAFDVYKYNDNSGYKIDLDLWINNARSDLTIQLEIKDDGSKKKFLHRILDVRVM